jgi:hypothetical protein
VTSQKELDSFIAKFTPEIAQLARRVIAKMRKRLPGVIQLVYDNYNALAIGFGPSERASEAIFSIALYPRNVNLFFLQGASLPDTTKRLKGSGKVVRFVTLTTADVLDEPEIRALMNVALNRAKVSLDPKQRGRLIIKSISAKQRPRRPSGKESR